MNPLIRSRESTLFAWDHQNACWDESDDCLIRPYGKSAARSGLMLLKNGMGGSNTEGERRTELLRGGGSLPKLSQSKRELVSDLKIESLLRLLRTEEFAGTIDLEHHSRYLSPPSHESPIGNFLGTAPMTGLTRKRSGLLLEATEARLKKAKSSPTVF